MEATKKPFVICTKEAASAKPLLQGLIDKNATWKVTLLIF